MNATQRRPSPTLGIATVTDAYLMLKALGEPRDALNQLIALKEADLENPDARLEIDRLAKLWDRLIVVSKDPAIGLKVGNVVHPERLSIVAQTVFQSEDFLQGLQQYVRFSRLVNEVVEVQLQRQQKDSALIFQFEPEWRHRSEVERTLSSAIAKARYAAGEHLMPKEVHFHHEAPDYAREYESIFRCPVLFSQADDRIVFSDKLLSQKSRTRNPYLLRALTRHAEELLTKLHSPKNVVDAVETYIADNLSQEKLDIESASQQLNMSRHTLYRKLKAHHVSFQSLLENARKNKSLELLEDTSLSLSEVAFMTGFSELSAFSRAFKRWTGETPAVHRKQH